jgi:DNA-binding MarR family transcriptional regulator
MITPKQGTERIGRRLKLRDLRILMTVVECGTMGKAAERLAISQPVVSKAIADMEYALGCGSSIAASAASSRRPTVER